MEVFNNWSNSNTGTMLYDAMSPLSLSDEDCRATTGVEGVSPIMLASACPKKRAGRKKFKETRHPVYRGIRQRSTGKWVCEVREPNKKTRIWLGTFPTAVMAARAHDVAAMALRGPGGACLNFADSPLRLPILPACSPTKDIQLAAARAAENFRNDEAGPSEACHVGKLEDGELSSYVDEDEDTICGMHGLMADLYQGLMLPPPPASWTSTVDDDDDDVDFSADVPLWSHSI